MPPASTVFLGKGLIPFFPIISSPLSYYKIIITDNCIFVKGNFIKTSKDSPLVNLINYRIYALEIYC